MEFDFFEFRYLNLNKRKIILCVNEIFCHWNISIFASIFENNSIMSQIYTCLPCVAFVQCIHFWKYAIVNMFAIRMCFNLSPERLWWATTDGFPERFEKVWDYSMDYSIKPRNGNDSNRQKTQKIGTNSEQSLQFIEKNLKIHCISQYITVGCNDDFLHVLK